MKRRGREYFLLFLAKELGMTLRRLKAEMSSYEVSQWQAYFREANAPKEEKTDPALLKGQLENAFLARNAKVRKKGKK